MSLGTTPVASASDNPVATQATAGVRGWRKDLRSPTPYLFLLTLAGISLWVINWWAARPLFLDEANVARNLFDRSFFQLFTPLDHQQYAPPLYLVMAKACGEVFGYSERALRLPALLAGLTTVIALFRAGRTLRLGWALLIPLGLLFANPTVLRYVTEVKPYALDLAVAAWLMTFALDERTTLRRWTAAGVLAPWLSLPSVFVLAAVGSYQSLSATRTDKLRWIGVIATWLAAFAALYALVLAPSANRGYLQNFHADHFFPLPTGEGFDLQRAASLVLLQLRLTFGFTAWSLLWGSLLTILALRYVRSRTVVLALVPVVIVFAVSATGKYSLFPRLLLFTLPGWWLLLGYSTQRLYADLTEKPTADRPETDPPIANGPHLSAPILSTLLALAWAGVLLGTNVARHYTNPLRTGDGRAVVSNLPPDYQPILHYSTLPLYDYYHRIAPSRNQSGLPPGTDQAVRSPRYDRDTSATVADSVFPTIQPPLLTTIEELPQRGSYAFLFATTTRGSIRRRVEATAAYARSNGAVDVRTERFFRAARVLVTYSPDTPPRPSSAAGLR